MYHVGKKITNGCYSQNQRVREEMKWIVPTVLETKGTFIFICANTSDIEQYLAIPIPSILFCKKNWTLLFLLPSEHTTPRPFSVSMLIYRVQNIAFPENNLLLICYKRVKIIFVEVLLL